MPVPAVIGSASDFRIDVEETMEPIRDPDSAFGKDIYIFGSEPDSKLRYRSIIVCDPPDELESDGP